MTTITVQEWWYLINKKFYYGPEAIESKLIQLVTTKWEAMRYWTTNNNIVSFPWEYDIDGENVRCWEAKNQLSFLVRSGKKSMALLSNKEVLEIWSFDDVDEFYCAEQSIIDEIERMDMWWEAKLFAGEEKAAETAKEETSEE